MTDGTLARDCGCPPSQGLLQSTWRTQGCFRFDTIMRCCLSAQSRHTEGEGFQRKEAGLARGPKEYYTAIRGGLCNAYLAASVVGSGLVSTSKIGAIGKVGTVGRFMQIGVLTDTSPSRPKCMSQSLDGVKGGSSNPTAAVTTLRRCARC